jgi:hypothetical protein
VGAARVEHATRPLGVKIVQCPTRMQPSAFIK